MPRPRKNYGRKRRVARKNTRRPVRQVRNIAKSVVMSQIPTKKHLIAQYVEGAFGCTFSDGEHANDPGTELNWVVLKPTALAKQHQDKDGNVFNTRTEQKIYANNYLLNGELMIPKETKGCVQVRVQMGWFKGTQTLLTSQFGVNALQQIIPTATSKFDPETSEAKAFKIVSDTMRTYYPIQIYDNTSGERTAESAGLVSDNVGLWKPIVVKRNFKFNRKFQYDGDEGDSQVGWVPYIAIGVFPCENASIGTTNASEYTRQPSHIVSPTFSYESRMYFKDINN